MNPCFDSNRPVCLNDGTCSINNLQSPYFKCSCRSGFSGNKCQETDSTTKVMKLTKKISNCIDRNPISCQYYSRKKLCSDLNMVNEMTINEYCPKSCLACGSAATSEQKCIDSDSNCVLWSASKLCLKLPDPLVCRKSCNLC